MLAKLKPVLFTALAVAGIFFVVRTFAPEGVKALFRV